MLGAGNQYRTKDAPIVAFFLSDLEVTKRIDRIQQLEKGKRDPDYMNMFPIASSFLAGECHAVLDLKQATTHVLSKMQPMPTLEPVQAWTYKSTALTAQAFVLAATSHDLATCNMEGYDGRRVKELLRIPDPCEISIAVAIGYDYDTTQVPLQTPRLQLEEVCFMDSSGVPLMLDEEEHDDDVPEQRYT
jgi:nitroreductase